MWEFIKSIGKNIKQNKGFVLTLFITYGLGFLFIVLSCVKENLNILYEITDNQSNEQSFEMLGSCRVAEIALDSILPTTIVYILSCLIANIECIAKRTDVEKSYDYNVFTIVALIVYTLLYAIYMTQKFNLSWFIIETICTLVILFLNVRSYNERNFNRNHTLTA